MSIRSRYAEKETGVKEAAKESSGREEKKEQKN